MATLPAEPVVSVTNVSKQFGGTLALGDVSMEFLAGEVHAVVGQNGSGKSTLIKVLSGFHTPDEGSVRIRGEAVSMPLGAAELQRLGIAFLHQELALVPTMSVLENLRVGRFATGALRRIRWQRERTMVRTAMARFGLDLDPDMPLGNLSLAQQAIVGIARAVQNVEAGERAGMLVLDEPTATLPIDEVELLFEAMRRVTAAGSAVLFVTHDIDEVLRITDRVSVLRDGRVAGTRPTSELDEPALISMILGRELGQLYPSIEGRPGFRYVGCAAKSRTTSTSS
jgi:ribose transport system ATP-binding protein